jgi:general secretion pathway protein G
MKRILRILVWTIRIVVYGAFALVLVIALYLNIPSPIQEPSQDGIPEIFVTEEIDNPLFRYKWDTGHYPTTEQGLMALIQAPPGVKNWHGPYLTTMSPVDPWRNAYHYRYPGIHNPATYDVWSSGPDGQDGTVDDIGNW